MQKSSNALSLLHRLCRGAASSQAATRSTSLALATPAAPAAAAAASYSTICIPLACRQPTASMLREVCSEGTLLQRLAQLQLRPFVAVTQRAAFAEGDAAAGAGGAAAAGTPAAAAAAGGTTPAAPGINPLQQVPTPASGGTDSAANGSSAAGAAGAGGAERAARAVLRGAHISPKKLTPFAKLLRRTHVEDALIQCDASPKKAAKICGGVLRSAVANARGKGMDLERLFVDEAFATKGQHLKRAMYHGRGRMGRMLKRRSHLTVILKEGDIPRRTRVIPPYLERLANRRPANAAAA